MTTQPYSPRVRPLQREVSLHPSVRSDTVRSYDEKRPNYIASPYRPGAQYQQLAEALSRWDTTLSNRMNSALDADAEEARETELAHLEKDFVQYTKENPRFLGYSPAWERSWKSARMERLGVKLRTDLQQAFLAQGWNNISSPEEFSQTVTEFTAAWRETNLPEDMQKEDISRLDRSVLARTFRPLQMQAESVLHNMYSEGRAKIHLEEGEQEFREHTYMIIENALQDGSFFHPGNPQGPARLGAQLAASRDRIMAAGVTAPMANALIKESLLQFAKAMDIESNDYRAEMLFEALNHIPTGTGVLGGTAASRLALAAFQDSSGDRRFKRESQYWQRKHWQEEEEKRIASTGIIQGLFDNPEASLEELSEKRGFVITADSLALFTKVRAHQAAAWEVAETPKNRFRAADFYVKQATGGISLEQVHQAYVRGELTTAQWTDLRGHFPEGGTPDKRVDTLLADAGFNDSLGFLKQTWKTPAAFKAEGEATEDRVLHHTRAHVAGVLFTAAVRKELTQFEQDKGTPATRQEVQNIIERNNAILSDTNNPAVLEAAKAFMKDTYSFATKAPLQHIQEAKERGGWHGPRFKPGPNSVIAKVPPRVIRLLDNAADKLGIDRFLLYTIAYIESSFREDAKADGSTATGLMQLTKATAETWGVNPNIPEENVLGGARQIAHIMKRYNTSDPGRIHYYNHDGPNATAPPSSAVKEKMEKARAFYNALKKEHEEQVIHTCTSYFEYHCPTLPDIISVSQALKNNTSHPVLTAFSAEITKEGGTPPSQEVLAQALGSLYAQKAATASPEEKKTAANLVNRKTPAPRPSPSHIPLTSEKLGDPGNRIAPKPKNPHTTKNPPSQQTRPFITNPLGHLMDDFIGKSSSPPPN